MGRSNQKCSAVCTQTGSVSAQGVAGVWLGTSVACGVMVAPKVGRAREGMGVWVWVSASVDDVLGGSVETPMDMVAVGAGRVTLAALCVRIWTTRVSIKSVGLGPAS